MYVVNAVRHVMMRQGVLGIKVTIMLNHDPEGKTGPATQLADVVVIHDPKPLPTPVQPTPIAAPGPAADAGFGGAPAPIEP